jgi:lipopolysaccharide export LptBFGC system permease protein LptF
VIRIFDRYISRQLLMPFFAWMLGMLVMIAGSFVFQVLRDLGQRDIPVREVLIFVASRLPWGLIMSIPMAFAFAACLSVNRMNRDGEIVALRVGGVSPRRLSLPIIGTGLIFSLGALVLNDTLVPWAAEEGRKASETIMLGAHGRFPESDLFIDGPGGYIFFAKRLDANTGQMWNIMVLDRDSAGYRTLVTASTGMLESEVVRLAGARRHRFDAAGRKVDTENGLELTYDLGGIIQDLYEDQKPLEEMYIGELLDRAEVLAATGSPINLHMHTIHMKLALPFATLMFALVAMPIVLRWTGSGFTGAMMAIGIIFVYYTVTAWGKILADAGQVNPVFGAWICNLLFAVVGGLLYWRSA